MKLYNFIGVFASASLMFAALGNGFMSFIAGFALAAMLGYQSKDQKGD